MSSAVSTAIIPKARAIFSRRLSPAEYRELAGKHSVAEVAQYLKAHPNYAEALETLTESSASRGQLEQLLNRDIYYKYESLFRYDFSLKKFGSFFMVENEIREILSALRFILHGRKDAYIIEMPTFLSNECSFSLMDLARANTPAQLLAVLEHTPYYSLLQGPFAQTPINFFLCEKVLKTYFYRQVFTSIEKNFARKDRTSIRSLFLFEAELYNLDILFRIKTYFPTAFTPQEIDDILLPFYHYFTKQDLKDFARAKNETELAALYANTRFARKQGDFETVVRKVDDTLYALARRIIHFSTSPNAVFAALLAIEKMERANVVNVIEGVRYGLPPDKIAALLRH